MNTLAKWICPLAITLAGACHGVNRGEGDPSPAAPVPAVPVDSTDEATDPLVAPTRPEDTEVDEWLARLDSLMTIPENAYDIFDKGRKQLRAFNDSLRSKLLSPEQTGRIVAYIDELLVRHPEARKLITEHRHLVENLTPGRVAPDIVGTDIDGVEFRLADYRGNIVVLFFTGEWCAPCRAAYPYQRRMLKRYKDEKVVLLGVNSDRNLETVKEAKEREALEYRTWWDESTRGPIATSWVVWAWPTTYILDGQGVIRHVNPRLEQLIEAVDALLREGRAADLAHPAM